MSEFPNVTWVTESSHPASRIAYQVAEVNTWPGDPNFIPGQFARVVKGDDVLLPPMRNTVEAYRAYNRFVRQAIEDFAREEIGGRSNSYAEYELAKIDKGHDVRVKFWDSRGGETRKLKVTPTTMAKVAAILRDAPENQW